jgi:hypothetical protein
MTSFLSRTLFFLFFIGFISEIFAATHEDDVERYNHFRKECTAHIKKYGKDSTETQTIIESHLKSKNDKRNFLDFYCQLQRTLPAGGNLRRTVNAQLLRIKETESQNSYQKSRPILKAVQHYVEFFGKPSNLRETSDLPPERATLLAFHISEFGCPEAHSPFFVLHLRELSPEKFSQILLFSESEQNMPFSELAKIRLKNQLEALTPLRSLSKKEDLKKYRDFVWDLLNSKERFPIGKTSLIPLLFECPSICSRFAYPQMNFLIEGFTSPEWIRIQKNLPLKEIEDFLKNLQGRSFLKEDLTLEFQRAFFTPYKHLLTNGHSSSPEILGDGGSVTLSNRRVPSSDRISIHYYRDLANSALDNIKKRLGTTPLIPFSEILPVLKGTLFETTRANQKSFLSTISDERSQNDVRTVYTFLKTFHPEKIPIWLNQWVQESLDASSISKSIKSCDIGIRIHITAGLRGTDDELDRDFFSETERIALMRNFCNILTPTGRNLHQLARYLVFTLKITQKPVVEDVITKISDAFDEKLREYRLQNNEQLKAEKEVYLDAFAEELQNPESALCKELQKIFSTTSQT